MLSAKIKDLKYRSLFLKLEKKRLINKFLFIHLLNKNFKNIKKKNLYILFFLLKKNKFNKLKLKSKNKIVRRCILSNRNRGIYRPYNLSRFYIREFIQFGILPGYKKAAW